jgi:hypothetical protein
MTLIFLSSKKPPAIAEASFYVGLQNLFFVSRKAWISLKGNLVFFCYHTQVDQAVSHTA